MSKLFQNIQTFSCLQKALPHRIRLVRVLPKNAVFLRQEVLEYFCGKFQSVPEQGVPAANPDPGNIGIHQLLLWNAY